ncbi:MAG: folate-binding protein [Pseudomonadota bacterium]
MSIEHLTSRAVLAVSGADAQDLLQRVITANVDTLPEQTARDCALLTPQGKILFQFLISRSSDGFRIDCPADDRDALMKRLSLYKLRSDVELAISDLKVITSERTFEGAIIDERAPELGWRAYDAQVPVTQVPGKAELEKGYHARRWNAGIPEIGADYDTQSTFAHEALLDLTQGIDFRKGCYVGQEVVSRVEHRSKARKRFVKIAANDDLPAKGADIVVAGKTVGTMGSSNGQIGLALVRLDKLPGADVEVDSVLATLSTPKFASFTIGADEPDA